MGATQMLTCIGFLIFLVLSPFKADDVKKGEVMRARVVAGGQKAVSIDGVTFTKGVAPGDDSTDCQRSRGLLIEISLCFSHNVEFKAKPGASPELFLLNAEDEVLETIDLSPLDEKECNELLLRKGFYKKPNSAASVPDQFLNGPYVEIQVDKKQEKDDL